MLIIELTYKKPIQEADKFLQAHRDFLDEGYRQGFFLASGPKSPRDGGIILSKGDKETVSRLLTEDPFYQEEIADYKITVFEANRYSPGLNALRETMDTVKDMVGPPGLEPGTNEL